MSIVNTLIGGLAPHLCIVCATEGAVLCDACLQTAGEPVQPRCAGCKALSDGYRTCSSCRNWLDVYAVYAAVPYDGVYEQLVRAYKFDTQRDAARPMATMMQEVETAFPSDSIVCTVPSAPARIRSRGFDHAKLLLREYAKQTGLPSAHILARHTNNRQLGSSREKRLQQMQTEFYVPNPEQATGKNIVVIDDVMTTGATLAGVAKALRQAGAKRVYAIVFAQAG